MLNTSYSGSGVLSPCVSTAVAAFKKAQAHEMLSSSHDCVTTLLGVNTIKVRLAETLDLHGESWEGASGAGILKQLPDMSHMICDLSHVTVGSTRF